jgi:hypothetical protein
MTMLDQDMFRFVGLPEQQATATAEEMGLLVRVTQRDGVPFPGTADIRTDRINFVISSGVVTEAKIG